MRPDLVDSDIVIDYLRGLDKAVAYIHSMTDNLCFSAVTVAEIHSGVKDDTEAAAIQRLFAAFPVIPIDLSIAREAGRLVRQFQKSHNLELPDALIAASCLAHRAVLHTLNTKHYPMFPELRPPYRKG